MVEYKYNIWKSVISAGSISAEIEKAIGKKPTAVNVEPDGVTVIFPVALTDEEEASVEGLFTSFGLTKQEETYKLPKMIRVDGLEVMTRGFVSAGKAQFAKDVETKAPYTGLILVSPSGIRFLVTVSDTGTLVTTKL